MDDQKNSNEKEQKPIMTVPLGSNKTVTANRATRRKILKRNKMLHNQEWYRKKKARLKALSRIAQKEKEEREALKEIVIEEKKKNDKINE
jgi:hypothetical protein